MTETIARSAAPARVAGAGSARRGLFVVTILVGSFLLFLVQPMVARMALPRLGGAPNVWNSAMLVYQALLLAGYGYAHLLGKLPLRRQAAIHLVALLLAGLTLPVGLVALPPAAPGAEVLWVPLLLGLSIGPVFFVVSAQAPLMQRWYAADPRAGEPWALYAASNLGSFVGLLAYPLLAEPLLTLHQQSLLWTAGFVLLIVLVATVAAVRRGIVEASAGTPIADAPPAPTGAAIGGRTIALWLLLSAVPSGLMLSTTTHLTTDIFAMPLLWVIPLGLYLLSFVFAFAEKRGFARVASLLAPATVLLAGGFAMVSEGGNAMTMALASTALLFVLAVTLHARLYDLRPDASRLTLFYFVMSAGGALGGAFTALIAPVAFDWTWEHPLLILAAALLLPVQPKLDWRRLKGLEPGMARLGFAVLCVAALFLCRQVFNATFEDDNGAAIALLTLGVTAVGVLLLPWRPAWFALLVVLMLAQGGLQTIRTTLDGARTRSYFGIYTVRRFEKQHVRTLAHGTTLHGKQSTLPAEELAPTTYYGDSAGVGLALDAAPEMFGPHARIGIVGLGTGTLACRHRAGQDWTFFEIDPVIEAYSKRGDFTFMQACAPQARVVIGDARLDLEKVPPGRFDVLVIDAFSSDAIPLHLLTDEAVATYERALAPGGLLLIHISNRFIDLEPVLCAIARERGLTARVRLDVPGDSRLLVPSKWVVLARDPQRIGQLAARRPEQPWKALKQPVGRVWTDDYASILPFIRWHNMVGFQ